MLKTIIFLSSLLFSGHLIADVCSVKSVQTAAANGCESDFDYLTRSIFDQNIDNTEYLLNHSLQKAVTGEQFLFCSIIADYIERTKESQTFYDKGMEYLDEYTANNSIRKFRSPKEYPHTINDIAINSLPGFYSSWVVNNKDVFKGMIFYKIRDIIDLHSHPFIGKQAEKVRSSYQKIYSKQCSDLLN